MSIFTRDKVAFSADKNTYWEYDAGAAVARLVVDGTTVQTLSASTAISETEFGYLDGVSTTPTASKLALHNGSAQLPVRRVVNVHTAATATLAAVDSGSLNVFDRAAGIVITLPTNAAGLWFDFFVKTSVTAAAYKVITAAGTQFILGQLVSVDTDSTNALAYDQVGDGSTHVAISMNGTTTGGLIYTRYRLVCISATQWLVDGMNFGSGVVATPFATS